MYDREEVLRTVQANVALEEDTFELLQKHLRATDMDLEVFLSLLVHSKMTEVASLGFLSGVSEASTQQLISELAKLGECSRTQLASAGSESLKAEDLVSLDSDMHPAFYQAQMRVMGTA